MKDWLVEFYMDKVIAHFLTEMTLGKLPSAAYYNCVKKFPESMRNG